MEYGSIKRNELLVHKTAWRNLNMMLNEKPEPKGKVTYDSVYLKFKNKQNDAMVEKHPSMVESRLPRDR